MIVPESEYREFAPRRYPTADGSSMAEINRRGRTEAERQRIDAKKAKRKAAKLSARRNRKARG